MSTEENKSTVRRLYAEVFNKGNIALASEFVTPGFVDHAAPEGTPVGPETLKYVVKMIRRAFPDGRYTIDDLIAEGDKVVVYLTLMGTHNGPLWGIPASGKPVTQRQMHILRFEEGRLAEHWAVRDDLGAFEQMGVVQARDAALSGR